MIFPFGVDGAYHLVRTEVFFVTQDQVLDFRGMHLGCFSDAHVDKLIAASMVKEASLAQVKKLKVGNPFEEDTFIGPMNSEKDAERIEDWAKEAVEKGGKLLAGGGRKGAVIPAQY
ncbi:hypothetical protein M758_6G110400 [Ceratodon purpureus]|uniref:NADP-dependent glyceraldehyde-3-phosphate dehydrogenase n=1 Tax=Ceratodon purpureus TaxID=3225 RepID=A0A8T0HGJ5_CERPU|nr:hypothetical protein KC19_6G115200 [Ceratodon purpureus]KAG0613531.1 hypothetical protein M758_6G110400 [Ceratodon purpureus]